MTNETRTNLRISYNDRHIAKGAGAKWDAKGKTWYVIGEVPVELQKYATTTGKAPSATPKALAQITYLVISYNDRHIAKGAGAKWDADMMKWYVIGEVPEKLQEYTIKAYNANLNGENWLREISRIEVSASS